MVMFLFVQINCNVYYNTVIGLMFLQIHNEINIKVNDC